MLTPSEYGQRARNLFLRGYNCSQSVVGAFADMLNLEEKQALRLISPFGGGMGRMREVCGCVSGMLLILGYLYGYDDPKVYNAKKELYSRVQEVSAAYRARNGSIICRELLGEKASENTFVPEQRTAEYYKKRPCPDLAACAAEILASYIQEHPPLDPSRDMTASSAGEI